MRKGDEKGSSISSFCVAGVLNLACDHPVLRRDYYDRVMDAAGLPRMRWTGGEGPPRDKPVSNARLEGILGLRLRHPSL